jgi:hypothetical protein
MAITVTKLPISTTEKGIAGGVATLDNSGYIPLSQIPPGVVADSGILQVNSISPDENGNCVINSGNIPEGSNLYFTQARFETAFNEAVIPFATDEDLNTEIQNRVSEQQTLQGEIDLTEGRLDVIEGVGDGSIIKAFNDANAYADSIMNDEANARQLADANLQTQIDGKASQASVTSLSNRVDSLESIDADGRLDAIEGLNLDSRVSSLEGVDAGNRLNSLESIDAGNRLNSLEGVGADSRITALESIDADGRLDSIEALDISDRLSALEGVDSGDRIYALETDLTSEVNRATTAESNLNNLIQSTNVGVGLSQSTGNYIPPSNTQFLGDTTSVLSALTALDTNLATVFNDFDLHHLHSNSFYVNDNSSDIQTVHDLANFGQGATIYVGSGSYGGDTLSLTKSNFLIQCPAAPTGSAICELSGGRGVTISGETCTRVRIVNLQIEGAFTINGTEGRHYFKNVDFQSTVSITGTSNFIVFEDCSFSGGISLASNATATVYFNRCALNNNLVVSLRATPLLTILTQCSGLNASQTNLTSNVALVGQTAYSNNAVIESVSSSLYTYNLLTGAQTSFSGAYSELRGKPTIPSASTELLDSADILRTSNIGSTAGKLVALDGSGKIDGSLIPNTVITDVHTVADEAARLDLENQHTLNEGDIAIQTDDGTVWIWNELGAWVQINTGVGGGSVNSVNGKTGSSITLTTDDIAEPVSPTNKWFTDTRAKTAAVVNSTSGTETDQAPSVNSIKSYISTQLGSYLPSSSYTASDVFDKVKSLDGVGSGLDADLLDGLNSDVFVQTSGSQSIGGVKTFTDAPIVPNQTALDGSGKIANTKYVDDAINQVQINAGANGTVIYKGEYNITTNTPVLTSAKKGYLYTIVTDGQFVGVDFLINDQILFVNDVQGGVVADTDFVKIDNTEATLTAGGIAIVNLANGVNKQLTTGTYNIYSGASNATLTLPYAKGTASGTVLTLRHTGTGILTISGPTYSGSPNSTGSYGTKIIYGNTGNLRTLTLTKAGEYKFLTTSSRSVIVASPLGVPQYDYEVVMDCTATNGAAIRTTDDLTEGTTNKYATASNVRAHLSAIAPIVYTQGTGVISTTLTQYTDALAKSAAVVDSMAGTQTDQAPSVSSVKAYYTAGTGISLSGGSISTTITQYTDELAQDAIATMISNGSHTGISYTYGDSSNKLDSAVSLSGFSIDALSDVDTTTTSPTSGQALAWDGSSKWIPTTIGGFSLSSGDRAISTNTNATATTDETYYVCTASLTVTLPVPSSLNVGKKIIVKSYTNSAVTISSNTGSQIIYDSTSPTTSIVHTANFPGFSTTMVCLEVGSGTYFWVVI